MRDKILIVGGYGEVGQYVSEQLVNSFPKKIIIAGRDYEKAKKMCISLDEMASPLQLDIYDGRDLETKMAGVRVVVMCLSPRNNNFAIYCIKNGVHYIDISPSNDTVSGLEDHGQTSELSNATCVLGVGLAPGLSNLMVKKLCHHMDSLSEAAIFLMLGLGENHGADGVKWLLDNLEKDFSFVKKGKPIPITPFMEKKKTLFPQHLGERTAYRFNLADQYIIQKTLKIENAASYFCYDSRLITKVVHVLKRSGLFKLLKFKIVYRFLLKMFQFVLLLSRVMKLGTDTYGLRVDGTGTKNNRNYFCKAGIIGNNNSSLTGKLAAFVTKRIYDKNHRFGVFYLEELFDFDDLPHNFKINFEMTIENII